MNERLTTSIALPRPAFRSLFSGFGPSIGKLAALTFAVVASTANAVTYYWNGTGAINATASWGTNTNGTGTAPTNFTTAGNTFEIQTGQSPTLGSAWTISGSGSGLLIDTGGSFNASTFNPSLNLSMQSGASYTAGGTAGGTIPYSALTLGIISPGSNFAYNGAATGIPTLNSGFGNYTWAFSAASGSTIGDLTTTGSLTLNTNGQQTRLATGASTSRTWNVGGDLSVNSGTAWNLNNTSGTATGTANISGGLTNNGTIVKAANVASTINFNGTGSSNVQWGAVANTNFGTLAISIGANKTIVFTDSLNEGGASFTANGTLNLGGQVLSGAGGKFTLSGGATFITSNATGLDGAITVTGAKSFSTSANYEFRGASTGTALPSTVNSLAINRASGDVTLDGGSATQTVSGTLSILSGNLAVGATTNMVNAASLTMRNTQINTGVTVNLSGGVTFDATANGTATIAGNLGLGGATRFFSVANGTAATDMSITGVISNGGLNKTGAGTLSLSGTNTYTGVTALDSGTLLVNGDQSGASGAVAVNNGGTLLGGSGAIGGSVTVNAGAIITGGNSGAVGNLTLSGSSSLTFNGASGNLATYAADISGITSDLLSVGGLLDLSNGFDQITFFGTPDGTSSYTLATYSALSGTFENAIVPSGYTLSYGTSQLELVPVPEPSAVAVAMGLLGLVGWRERRKGVAARRVSRVVVA